MQENDPPTEASVLTFEEARVLGCLIEKEISTPEHYPLTMNAVIAAANQKSNRDPVVEWDERTVDTALMGLRRRRLAVMISMAGARVPKYRHTIENVWGTLDPQMTAILCELLLRNGQSFGELRARASRLHPFAGLDEVERTVDRLVNYGVEPLAVIVPPGSGRRVSTVYHLLCGPPQVQPSRAAEVPVAPPPADDWRSRIEAEIAALREEIAELRRHPGVRIDPPSPSAPPPADPPLPGITGASAPDGDALPQG